VSVKSLVRTGFPPPPPFFLKQKSRRKTHNTYIKLKTMNNIIRYFPAFIDVNFMNFLVQRL
jgi:hypothetical protein